MLAPPPGGGFQHDGGRRLAAGEFATALPSKRGVAANGRLSIKPEPPHGGGRGSHTPPPQGGGAADGSVPTDTSATLPPLSGESFLGSRRRRRVDPKNWVAPDELASVVEFLASPKSRAIHGAAIPVTGLV